MIGHIVDQPKKITKADPSVHSRKTKNMASHMVYIMRRQWASSWGGSGCIVIGFDLGRGGSYRPIPGHRPGVEVRRPVRSGVNQGSGMLR